MGMSNSKREKRILKAFWKAIEARGATWDELASGKTIFFTFEGNRYEVKTGASGNFRTRSSASYERTLDQRALDAVGPDPNAVVEPVDRKKLRRTMRKAARNDPDLFVTELLEVLRTLDNAHLEGVFFETGDLTGRR